MGTSVTGTLTAADPVLPSDSSHYKLFTFYGTAGQTVEIRLVSSDFDAYVYLRDQNGQIIAQDDDSGGGLNALIFCPLPRTGTYQILANAQRANEYGTFTLSLAATVDRVVRTPTPTPAQPPPVHEPVGATP